LGAGGVIPNALLLAKRASPLSRWGLFIAVGAAVLAGIELVISIVVPFC
jgi:hypothetical protein